MVGVSALPPFSFYKLYEFLLETVYTGSGLRTGAEFGRFGVSVPGTLD